MTNMKSRATFTKDGSAEARRIGINHFSTSEIYHSLVLMSWTKFFLLLFLSYFTVTLIFTLMYTMVGFENFNGLATTHSVEKFWQVFLFNAQTLSTVGGSGVTPSGFTNNIILTVESMTAMLGMAVVTGLLYVRFSRPSTGIVYSTYALVAPYQKGNGLMFRIANAKKNELAELNATLFLVAHDLVANKRDIKTLKLERSNLPFLAHAWTIVHPITQDSQLNGFEWKNSDLIQYEITIWISGIDRITGQNVFSGHTYLMSDVIHNAKFTSCMDVGQDGHILVLLNKLSDYEMV